MGVGSLIPLSPKASQSGIIPSRLLQLRPINSLIARNDTMWKENLFLGFLRRFLVWRNGVMWGRERARAKYPPPNWTCSNNQAEKGMGKKGVNGNTHGMRRRESILQNFQMLSPREREETFIRKLENIRCYVLFVISLSVCGPPSKCQGQKFPHA